MKLDKAEITRMNKRMVYIATLTKLPQPVVCLLSEQWLPLYKYKLSQKHIIEP